MAKSKKKVITTGANKAKLTPTKSQSKAKSAAAVANTEMLFGRENFKFILIGLALIFLGMILMIGGGMPSPDVWDESLIYSHRRITLAPILILAGLGVEVYAIFKK